MAVLLPETLLLESNQLLRLSRHDKVVKRFDESSETVDHVVFVIDVTVGQYSWSVRKRYTQFRRLHEHLCEKDVTIDSVPLPEKNFLKRFSESFIEKRRSELEVYLLTVLHKLQCIPPALAVFLEFEKYEVHWICRALTENLHDTGDVLLQKEEAFQLTALQLHSVTERLTLPEPSFEENFSSDIGHCLDYFARVRHLEIVGSETRHQKSNIVMNHLPFSVSYFKSLHTLVLNSLNLLNAENLITLLLRVRNLHVHGSLSSLSDLRGRSHGANTGFSSASGDSALPQSTSTPSPEMHATRTLSADFSHNNLTCIDSTILLFSRLVYLDLSHNTISQVQHLQHLPGLLSLNLAHNQLHDVEELSTVLGNIRSLDLAHNKLTTLTGLHKLSGIEVLDCSHNRLEKSLTSTQLATIESATLLPCIRVLQLANNPVTTTVDYRVQLLTLFADRASEVTLDDVAASSLELERVSILLALRQSRKQSNELDQLTQRTSIMNTGTS